MISKNRLIQLAAVAVAAGLMALGGVMQAPLQREARQAGTAPGEVFTETNPRVRLFSALPGVVRTPLVNYFWIRTQELKQDGRHFDAMQLADLICALQPRFAHVWTFHAWNMAWNISVMTHTEEERWLWVTNGMKLLRDQAIPQNPRSLELYRELSWLFFFKMGGNADEMHRQYKQRWAAEMQRVLGAPPPGPTREVIEAFRPVAEAPLDANHPRRGKGLIQRPMRRRLLDEHPAVADLLERLAPHGVQLDRTLLDAYNRYSKAPDADIVRFGRPVEVVTDRDEALYALINPSGEWAELRDALDRAVAFVRAQVLWNDYRLDPRFMLEIMETYNVPLDWRQPWAHGLYWALLGDRVVEQTGRRDITELNTLRNVLNSLKDLTWQGRMVYIDDPQNPAKPGIGMHADWRYVEPTHQAHLRLIEAVRERQQRRHEENPEKYRTPPPFHETPLASGHRNYLVNGILMLVAGERIQRAQELLDWIRETYKMSGEQWDIPLVRDFAVEMLNREGSPIAKVANNLMTISIQTAYVHLSQGDARRYRDKMAFARRILESWQAEAADRLRMQRNITAERNAFDNYRAGILQEMLVSPRSFGYRLSLVDRSTMFQRLPDELSVVVYDAVAPMLAAQCATADPPLDFQVAFPAPEGLDEYRRARRERFPVKPDKVVED